MATNKNSTLGKKKSTAPVTTKNTSQQRASSSAGPLIHHQKGSTNPQVKNKVNAANAVGRAEGATTGAEAWKAYHDVSKSMSGGGSGERDAAAAMLRSNAPPVPIRGASADPGVMASGLRGYNPQAMPWAGGVKGAGGRDRPTSEQVNPGTKYGWGGRDNDIRGTMPLTEFSDETDGPSTIFNQSDRQLEQNRRNQTPFQIWMNSGRQGPMPRGDTNLRPGEQVGDDMDPSLTKFDTDQDGKVSFEEQRAANGVSPGSFAGGGTGGGTFKAPNATRAKEISNAWNQAQETARGKIGPQMPGMTNTDQQLAPGVKPFGGQADAPSWLEKARSSSGSGGGGYRPSPSRPPNMWAGGTPDFDESGGGGRDAAIGPNPMFGGGGSPGMSPGTGQPPAAHGRQPMGAGPGPGAGQAGGGNVYAGGNPNFNEAGQSGPGAAFGGNKPHAPMPQPGMAPGASTGSPGMAPNARLPQQPQMTPFGGNRMRNMGQQPQQQPQGAAASRASSLSSALRGG